jgi:hypothetical protein
VVQLAVTATDGLQTSLPEFTTVTVNPAPDVVTITAAQYRISKQRLTINASDSINPSTNIVLTLQPYVTTTGTTFDPCSLGQTACVFLYQGTNLYLLDALGLPEPAVPPAVPLLVRTNIAGSSGSFGLTSIRQ